MPSLGWSLGAFLQGRCEAPPTATVEEFHLNYPSSPFLIVTREAAAPVKMPQWRFESRISDSPYVVRLLECFSHCATEKT